MPHYRPIEGVIPSAVNRTMWREVINDVALRAALSAQEWAANKEKFVDHGIKCVPY